MLYSSPLWFSGFQNNPCSAGLSFPGSRYSERQWSSPPPAWFPVSNTDLPLKLLVNPLRRFDGAQIYGLPNRCPLNSHPVPVPRINATMPMTQRIMESLADQFASRLCSFATADRRLSLLSLSIRSSPLSYFVQSKRTAVKSRSSPPDILQRSIFHMVAVQLNSITLWTDTHPYVYQS